MEHLESPERFIERLADAMKPKPHGKLILSTGNIAFAVTRFLLLAGQFNYGKRGILDLTHTRLFTFGTLRRLLEGAGFQIQFARGVPAPFQLALGEKPVGRVLSGINRGLIRMRRQLFSYQIFVLAQPQPSLAYLLDQAQVEARTRTDAREEGTVTKSA